MSENIKETMINEPFPLEQGLQPEQEIINNYWRIFIKETLSVE